MAFNPTKSQSDAIFASSGTLVSAAAGSGKTAVLAERVVHLLTKENPISADRILVVTFMSAAAEEMRSRIEARLNKEFSKNPDNKFLYSQKLKLNNAKICTIDSFCIDLVREHFDYFEISPDFKIGDDSSVKKISDSVLGGILNQEFENGGSEFLALLNALCSRFDETDLKEAIIGLYNFSENLPFPKDWLNNLSKNLNEDEYVEKIFNEAFLIIKNKLKNALKKILLALSEISSDEDLKDKYEITFLEEKDFYEKLLSISNNEDWDKLYFSLDSFSFARWSTSKKLDAATLDALKELRDSAKSVLNDIKEIVYADKEEVKNQIISSLKLAVKLIELTREYSEKFYSACLENNILTFSQAEHFALQLLCKNENGEIKLTELSEDIISRFDEVLVDEFQDINDMQDLLFNILSKNEKNLFVVGDVKQSIYKFRGSNPENFLRKQNSYLPFENANSQDFKKIILGNNFRSRKGICDYVNFVFSQIMNGEKSSVKYGKDEELVNSAVYPENDIIETEVHYIDILSDDYSSAQFEAQHIANLIKDYKKNGFVSENDALKRPNYSDFAVILRGVKSKGAIYAETFRKNGIPVKFSSVSSFESSEVKIILSLLTVIANPSRDIELVSVLMSPLFNFTADELALIKANSKKENIITAVTKAALSGNEKANNFINSLNFFRTASVTLSLGDLIDYLYDKTSLPDIVSALPEGKIRRDNLLKLYLKALEYEENGYSKNILKFIDFIDSVKETESGSMPSGDAVTITTIHKSKGLQFPICIVSDTSKRFSGEDTRKNLLSDIDFGVAFRYFDNELNEKREALQFKVIKERTLSSSYEEEMRLLYVAFTRAKEKLIIVNSSKKTEEKLSKAFGVYSICKDKEQYRTFLEDSNSYFDWILKTTALFKNDLSNSDFAAFKFVQSDNIDFFEEDFEIKDNGVADLNLSKKIREVISFKYPFEQVRSIASKSSVTAIAHKADSFEFSFNALPDFMSSSGLSAAKRGTATHRFMQFCDFSLAEKDVKAELDRLYEFEFISEAEHDAVDIESVEKFFRSDVYNRIKNSDYKREMRFITEIEAGRIDKTLPENVKNEPIVIQGSVDLLFEENGKIVILDFKTDRITDEEKLRQAYSEQLKIYATACEQILGKPIGECMLYSFKLGKTIKI